MVARLSFCSVSLAQKPKSAVKKGKVSVSVLHQVDEGGRGDELTDLNVALLSRRTLSLLISRWMIFCLCR